MLIKVSMAVCVCVPSCLTLCNPMDCSPPGSSVQAKILESVAFSTLGDLPDPGIKPTSLAAPYY